MTTPMIDPVAFAARTKSAAVSVSDRPGWGFDLAGELLEPPEKVGDSPWTDEQRTNGIAIDFVYLTPDEEIYAMNEAAKSCRGAAINVAENPFTMIAFRAKAAFAMVDGKPVPHLEKDRYWKGLGEAGRSLVTERYNDAVGASVSARARAASTFRVRS